MRHFVFAAAVLVLAGCERKQTVSGQIFVRAGEGQTYKLSLSKVVLIDKAKGIALMKASVSDFSKELDIVNRDIQFQMDERRQMEQINEQKKIADGKIEAVYYAMSKRYDSTYYSLIAQNSEEAGRKLKMIQQRSRGLNMASIKTVYERAASGLKTNALASATCDVDGRFQIEHPRKIEVFVLAFGYRDTNLGREQYLWFLPAGDGMMLHNENLYTRMVEFRPLNSVRSN